MNDPSSIFVGVQENAICIRVETKGTFQNSPGIKKFANEMIERGYRTVQVDLGLCASMDSTFMGTLTGIALKLARIEGELHIYNISERNNDSLSNLGIDSLMTIHPLGEEIPCMVAPENSRKLDPSEADRREQTEVMLKAHEALIEAQPKNRVQFKDVLDFIRDDLEKMPPR